VAAYLRQYDLTGFDPKAPPPKTAAFWAMVDAGRAPEDAELADVLDALSNPNAVTLAMITARAEGSFRDWLTDRRNSKQISHRMTAAHYAKVPSQTSDKLWVIRGKRQAVYAKVSLAIPDQYRAAADLVANR
jgi:hypothetical protein